MVGDILYSTFMRERERERERGGGGGCKRKKVILNPNKLRRAS